MRREFLSRAEAIYYRSQVSGHLRWQALDLLYRGAHAASRILRTPSQGDGNQSHGFCRGHLKKLENPTPTSKPCTAQCHRFACSATLRHVCSSLSQSKQENQHCILTHGWLTKLWSPDYNTAPKIRDTQERDHNFDNHPHASLCAKP